ncbi:hypothetical protein SRABI03_02374 [Microbacterium foliorum]|nr:hypothetical protein SRABI03_02374 [Microbacterium foliorum]
MLDQESQLIRPVGGLHRSAPVDGILYDPILFRTPSSHLRTTVRTDNLSRVARTTARDVTGERMGAS